MEPRIAKRGSAMVALGLGTCPGHKDVKVLLMVDPLAHQWYRQRIGASSRFVAFLDHLLTAYPGHPLYLVLDNAPTHTATVVARWAAAHPRAQLLWLPTYAAHEANPVERIWGLLKSEVAADRLEGTLATLIGHARRFCAELAPHPVKLPAVA